MTDEKPKRLFDEEKFNQVEYHGTRNMIADLFDSEIRRNVVEALEKVRPIKHEQAINSWMKIYAARIDAELARLGEGKE